MFIRRPLVSLIAFFTQIFEIRNGQEKLNAKTRVRASNT